MSYDWMLRCDGCDERSEDYNHGRDLLVAAARTAQHVWALCKADPQWDVSNLEYSYLRVGSFLARHFEHGGFSVVSEYWDRYRNDPVQGPQERVIVEPTMPPDQYAAACLPYLVEELERLRGRADDLLAKAKTAESS